MRTGKPALAVVLTLGALLSGCGARVEEHGAAPRESAQGEEGMNRIAESYIRLALALGRHDKDYVDAYFGPEEFKDQMEREALDVDAIGEQARALLSDLDATSEPADPPARFRHTGLAGQIRALAARADLVGGKKLTFDEESRLLYDAVAPTHGAEHFDAIIARLDEALPGEGSVRDRYEAFRSQFIIPVDRLDEVFKVAIEACRERTARHITLPPGESFTVEYVTDKSWSGYNWYQGDFKSLIQVNTDFPIYIDRAIDLACHEGYPGHHVFHALQDQALVKEKGWGDYTIYPLFAPHSLIAEGSANYGIDITFPGEERVAYERDVLFPLAGLDPARAEEYYTIQALKEDLNYAGNEAARQYLDGTIDAAQATEWLMRYGLTSRERAGQRLRFIEQYRSYVINYNLGKDLVRRHVESRTGPSSSSEERWKVFLDLLAFPKMPSELG